MSRVSLLEFADKLNEVMPVIIKEFSRRQVNELYKGKITLPQFLVLEFLHSSGESKMTGLANFMSVTTAAMTGIVERLVRDGYVVRVFDPEDRRIIKIKLTAKGSGLVKKILTQRRHMIIKIFGRISKTERKEYLGILMHIKDILIKEELKK
jgi:DNA-binding MarR family transcriptional regulator